MFYKFYNKQSSAASCRKNRKENLMRLPEAFTDRMKQMLGAEFDDFVASYDLPRYHGLRVNTLKVPVSEFVKISPFALEPVPWASEGFYTGEDNRPAKHPYYHAGLYYIQEPSAMITAAVLDPRPGDRVLDLCAAPGGKSTQIAARLAGKGVLVSNDINFERIKGLVRNLEMFGVRNYIVLHELPARLAERFRGYFDKIVVDAPCSGEGMFRKDPFAVKSWGDYSIEKCAMMQKGILKHVSTMLKTGGHLVYSTCTFAPEENEGMINDFISKHPEFEPVEIRSVPGLDVPGLDTGRPEWAGAIEELRKNIRLWPHRIKGEGHFVALLQKTGSLKTGSPNTGAEPPAQVPEYMPPSPSEKELQDYHAFVEDSLTVRPEDLLPGTPVQTHSRLYMAPPGLPDLQGLKVIRSGWFLGELKKNRFKPVAPLALGLRKQDARRVLDFPSGSDEVIRYLKGETLDVKGEYGWNLVCVDGFPLGWAKQLKDRFNNYYPSGWRWMD